MVCEGELSVLVIAGDGAVFFYFAVKHLLAEGVLDFALDGSAQRSCAVCVVKALVGDRSDRSVGEGDRDVHSRQSLCESVEHDNQIEITVKVSFQDCKEVKHGCYTGDD